MSEDSPRILRIPTSLPFAHDFGMENCIIRISILHYYTIAKANSQQE